MKFSEVLNLRRQGIAQLFYGDEQLTLQSSRTTFENIAALQAVLGQARGPGGWFSKAQGFEYEVHGVVDGNSFTLRRYIADYPLPLFRVDVKGSFEPGAAPKTQPGRVQLTLAPNGWMLAGPFTAAFLPIAVLAMALASRWQDYPSSAWYLDYGMIAAPLGGFAIFTLFPFLYGLNWARRLQDTEAGFCSLFKATVAARKRPGFWNKK